MKIIRTPRAIEGFREVAQYIASQFGNQALQDFQKRTKEWTRLLKTMPNLGGVDEDISTETFEYRSIAIYKRSMMVYRIEGETIIIVDFYDTRRSVPSSILYE
jgi:plasmid stabilization system protein ParE